MAHVGEGGLPKPGSTSCLPSHNLGNCKAPSSVQCQSSLPKHTFCLARQNLVSRQGFGTVLVGVGAPPFAKVADDGFDGDPVSLNTLSFQGRNIGTNRVSGLQTTA